MPGTAVADEVAELRELLQHAQDELVGALETIRRQSAALGQARREDPEKKLRQHRDWDRGHRLFRIWQRATGHTNSRWSVKRFKMCLEYLGTYEDEVIERAIEGIAYDPYVTRSRNGLEERQDGWHTLFKSPDNLERYANKAPLNWKDTLLEHAEEVAART